MNDMIEINLHLVGISQIILALTHFGFPKRFGWKQDLASLTLLNRQLFGVHTFFVAYTIFLIGCLGLLGAEALVSPSPLAMWLSAGLLLFWLARLYCQFWVFDPSLWKGQSFNSLIHVLFGILWLWYSVTYGLVFVYQAGLLATMGR